MNDELMHYGVLGMKWGVRKEEPRSSKRHNSKSSNTSTKKSGKKKSNKKEPQTLSDAKTKEQRSKVLRNVVLGVGAAAGIGIGLYFAYKYNAVDSLANKLPMDKFKTLGLDNFLKEPEINQKAREILQDSYKNVSDAIIFKPGDTLDRIERFPGIDITKKKDLSYLSFTTHDKLQYMTRLGDFSGTGDTYSTVYKVIKDIKTPTRKEATSIFNNLLKTDPSFKQNIKDSLTKLMVKNNPFLKGLPKENLEFLANAWVERDPFKHGMTTIAQRGSDSKKLVKALTDKGYNAIVDYHDVMDKFTHQPVILLDPSSTVVKTGEKYINNTMKQLGAFKLKSLYGMANLDLNPTTQNVYKRMFANTPKIFK